MRKSIFDKDVITLARKAYEKYRLDWMLRHNKSLPDLLQRLDDFLVSGDTVAEAFGAFEEESGFNGEIWASFSEFLTNEFLYKDYMASILNDAEYAEYTKFITKLLKGDMRNGK